MKHPGDTFYFISAVNPFEVLVQLKERREAHVSASDLAAVEFKRLRTTSKLPTRHLDGRARAEEIGDQQPDPEKKRKLAWQPPRPGPPSPHPQELLPRMHLPCWRSAQLSSAKALSLQVGGLRPQPLEYHPHPGSGET